MPSLLQQAAKKYGIDIDTEPDDERRLTVYRDAGEAILKQLARIQSSRFTAGAVEVFVKDMGVIMSDLSTMRIRRSPALKAINSPQGAASNLLQAQTHLRKAVTWLEQDISVDQDVAARERRLKAIDFVTDAYEALASALEYLAPVDV